MPSIIHAAEIYDVAQCRLAIQTVRRVAAAMLSQVDQCLSEIRDCKAPIAEPLYLSAMLAAEGVEMIWDDTIRALEIRLRELEID